MMGKTEPFLALKSVSKKPAFNIRWKSLVLNMFGAHDEYEAYLM